MRTPCSLRGTRAASATFVKTRGDRDSPKGRTCTDMLVLRTQPQEWPVVRKDRHMEVRVFQVNAADRTWGRMHPKTQFCMSILKGGLWKAPFKMRRPKIGRNPPLSWAQWSKGWKTLPSYRLEGPVPSRPSPVGQWFLSQDVGIGCLHCCEVDDPNLGGRRANWIA